MRRLVLFVFVLAAAALPVMADAPRVGVVTGTVLGPDRAAMPGVTVQLISERGSEQAVSDADGEFRFVFVIPDTYHVRADLDGFQPAEGEIVVSAGGRADVVLRLAEVAGDEILVTGEVPLINKFDITGGGTTDAKELDHILSPAGRWHQTVLDFFPGVTQSQEGGGGAKDVEGNTANKLTYYIDGVDTSSGRSGGTSSLRLPTVAVGEIQLVASGADAEYSRTLGGLTTATIKSGTNQFRGAFSATFTNQSWDSTYDRFPGAQPPDEVDVRWEAALGGPIVRDRLWFFASAADLSETGYAVLPDGDYIDTLATVEPKIAKLDFRPSARHSLSLSYVDTPTTFPFFSANYGDRYAASDFLQGGEVSTLRWSWAISEDLFLETAVAKQDSFDTRSELFLRDLDPTAPPWSPLNNRFLYYDAATLLMRNAVALTLGTGETTYPRDQANLSLNWFAGDHDVKLGIDYQDTGWKVNTRSNPMVIGQGYNANLPGGFVRPLFIRYFTGPADIGGIENKSEVLGVFVRDRFSVGDHWTFNLGLRYDDQSHKNDVGAEIFSSTDLAPRLSAVYDVRADSTLLITASAGRYTGFIPMEMAQGFNVTPQGRNEYDQYAWNAATQDFDRYQGHVLTTSVAQAGDMKPGTMDQFTLGVEWAFHPDWAFKAAGLYYEQRDENSWENQVIEIDGAPAVGRVFESNPYATLDRTSLTLQVRRRFKDGWTTAASYTWSDTSGTCFSTGVGRGCALGLGEYRAITNPATGEPWSVENRDGDLFNGLTHVFKVRGSYLFPLGAGHSINVGGLLRWQSGRKWNMMESLQILPNAEYPTLPSATVTHFTEPMGSREIGSVYELDLNASWQFPLFARLEGSLLVEISNVTDVQDQVNVAVAGMLMGDPEGALTDSALQSPRQFRALATIRF